jgi:choice-of-anchor B domain-containing protein
MRTNILLLLSFIFLTLSLSAQKKSFNTTLLSSVSFGSENSNDIWGYVDGNGIKYAVIGNARNTRVFSLEDPENPVLRHTAPGAQSVWRDIKSYNNHLYVTTDQGTDGLVIIDMNKAPDTISHIYYKPELTVGVETKNLERCHNLYIDEKGFCYLSGCNISKRGVLIFDLKNDPKAPLYVGAADLNYSHDNFVRGDTLYSSEINVGQLGIYDITDRSQPVLLASRTTSRNFTHNAWPSDDSKYIFTTDERPNAYVDAYDISDLSNIQLLDKFRPLEREGDGVIPHNTHYFNGFLVTSWYTDGLRIVDAHKPDNLVEVAYYDTWEDQSTCHSGFSGCWGAFPFTDNNHVYASDINNGLFIVDVDYKRAAYLEGRVTDQFGNAVEGVLIEIQSEQINRKYSNAAGEYKTGHAFYGDFEVIATHPDFPSTSAVLTFNPGEVTEWNVVMEKPRLVKVDVTFENTQGDPIPGIIELRAPASVNSLNIDETGENSKEILNNTYDIIATSWGYLSTVIPDVNINKDTTIQITLEKGYEETFETNNEWEVVSSSANMSGKWERAVPRGTYYINNVIANPETDDETDFGGYAFVTQNGLPGAACADVDNGTTTLISPNIDLTGFVNPKLSLSYWFFINGGVAPFNDTLRIYITNGETEVEILKEGSATTEWQKIENIEISSLIVPTDDMRIIVEVSDLDPNGHIVEAGFDNLVISDGTSSVDQITTAGKLHIIPNPSSDMIYISGPDQELSEIFIYNMTGQRVGFKTLSQNMLDISGLSNGMYFIKSGNLNGKFLKVSE